MSSRRRRQLQSAKKEEEAMTTRTEETKGKFTLEHTRWGVGRSDAKIPKTTSKTATAGPPREEEEGEEEGEMMMRGSVAPIPTWVACAVSCMCELVLVTVCFRVFNDLGEIHSPALRSQWRSANTGRPLSSGLVSVAFWQFGVGSLGATGAIGAMQYAIRSFYIAAREDCGRLFSCVYGLHTFATFFTATISMVSLSLGATLSLNPSFEGVAGQYCCMVILGLVAPLFLFVASRGSGDPDGARVQTFIQVLSALAFGGSSFVVGYGPREQLTSLFYLSGLACIVISSPLGCRAAGLLKFLRGFDAIRLILSFAMWCFGQGMLVLFLAEEVK